MTITISVNERNLPLLFSEMKYYEFRAMDV
jgi:hypothetical protein